MQVAKLKIDVTMPGVAGSSCVTTKENIIVNIWFAMIAMQTSLTIPRIRIAADMLSTVRTLP